MRTDRRFRIAWQAYLAELEAMQMLERPSQAEIAERAKKYFHWRFVDAVRQLPGDSSLLAEVLNELFALLVGEDEVEGWRPITFEDARSRIGEPLIAMETNAARR